MKNFIVSFFLFKTLVLATEVPDGILYLSGNLFIIFPLVILFLTLLFVSRIKKQVLLYKTSIWLLILITLFSSGLSIYDLNGIGYLFALTKILVASIILFLCNKYIYKEILEK